MRYYSILLFLLLPLTAFAQDFQFQLDPDAFPVTINNWQPFQPWAGGMDYSTPELCDLDNDGDLDFFCGDYCGYVKYFKNIGTTTHPNFIFITDFLDSLHSAGLPEHGYSHVDFADIDGDGDKDALVSYSRVLLFHNIGTSMQPLFSINPDTLHDTNGNQIISMHATLVDINNDGKVDLFAGHYNGYIQYYQNVGTSANYSFQLISSNWLNTIVSGEYADPCFADLDSDGDLDLLVGTGDGTIYYYRNDGTPQNPQMTYVTNNYFSIDVGADASPELADIDGDGDLDLFVGRSHWTAGGGPGDVYFYLNVGTAQIPIFHLVTTNYLTWNCGIMAKPSLIDIDDDGDLDLISSTDFYLTLYRNQGTLANPHFVWETDNFCNISTPGACEPWFADMDADGDYDLFIGPGAIPGPPGLYFFRNQGSPQTPNFVLESTNLVPGYFTQGSVCLNPCTADIDADGDQDLFVKDNLGCCYFFRNVGTPTNFQFQYVTSNWQNFTGPYYYMNFYDIDGDGDLDLFKYHEVTIYYPWDKNLRFYRNIGTPQNANMRFEIGDMFPELMIWSACPYVIDMDQDGDGDLFVGDQWGGIRYFKNVTGDTTAVLHPDKVPIPPPRRTILSVSNNPSNPVSLISFSLPSPQEVSLSVYNILGSKVATLVSGKQSAGDHTVSWNATGNASGVYLVQLLTPQEAVTRKVVVVK
ncbi:MAG: FG-GAP-like repeat-containing protein [bacterium]|nr:FG-GAP-like repeat-containing protein [bacterium]